MKTRTKMVLAIGVVVAVIGSLITVGLTQANTYYWTIDELQNEGIQAAGKAVKLSGFIVGETISWDQENMALTFQLSTEENGQGAVLPVKYQGLKPDTMNDGWEAIVEGTMDERGVFQADQLLVKCPSKYEAMEEQGMENPHETSNEG